MRINNNEPYFKGAPMQGLTKGLYALENNDMLKAAGVDLFCTDVQRTTLEYKNRGKNAGIEMGFREFTGTFIVEFSSAIFALLTSKFMSKHYKPEIAVNPSSWATNDGLEVFNSIFKNSDKTPKSFVEGVINSMTGIAGGEIKTADKEIAKPAVDILTGLIKDGKKDKKALANAQTILVDALGADNSVFVKSEGKELKSNMQHLIRDVVDTGQNVFFNGVKPDDVISKLKTINKSRTAVAIPAAMALALTNQYINRKLTKKRTGIDNFVGENGYEKNVENKNESEKSKGLLGKKLLAGGVFLGMLGAVMGVKKPADLISKLEFTGPATSGSAIKTVYGTLILGRIFASKDTTELRETCTRDYLGFLNWLVLGDFVAKGVGQLLNPGKDELFNITNNGKNWLKDVSLKSQKEVIANGKNVSKNLKKLNMAQMSGIAYSALMLGFLLPKFNIWVTKKFGKNAANNNTGAKQKFIPTDKKEYGKIPRAENNQTGAALKLAPSFSEFLINSKTA